MRRAPDRAFRLAVATCAVGVFLVLVAFQSSVWDGKVPIPDTPHYRGYGDRMERGEIPYRDFAVEYPPGALPAFALPSLVAQGSVGYARAFAVLMVACGVAMVAFVALALAAVGAGRIRFVLAVGAPALTPVLLGPFVLTRFDLLPAALVAAATAALVAGRLRAGAATMGLATAVKLYPGALLPLVVVHVARRRGRREAVLTAGLAVAVVAAVFAVFAVLAPEGIARSVWRQLDRPLQIESLGSAVLLALHHLADMPLGWESSHGSQNLTGAVAVVAGVLVGLAQVAVVVWLWVRYTRGPAEPERFVLYAAAVVVALVALGRVLSPQFLVWLLPVVPLVRGARGLAASALLVVACLLTRGWFPSDYWALVRELDGRASALVVLRDLCLVALAAVLAWPTARGRGSLRSQSPSPSPGRT